jgi:hypothetical protein
MPALWSDDCDAEARPTSKSDLLVPGLSGLPSVKVEKGFDVRVIAGVVVCLLAASTAGAQTAFIEGGFSRDVRRFSHAGTASPFDGTVNGVWVNGSVFLAPRWSVGVELDNGEDVTFEDTVSLTLAGRPTEITTTYISKRRTISALAGLHTSPGRAVQLGAYAGLSFTRFRREISSDAPPIVLNESPTPAVFEDRGTDAVVGVDVAILLAPNLTLVPALRAQGLSLSGDLSGFSIRPSIGARVTF